MRNEKIYIKDGQIHIDNIVFDIPAGACVRFPDRYNDFVSLAPNELSLDSAGRWFLCWDTQPIRNISLRDELDMYDFEDLVATSDIVPVECNGLRGFAVIRGFIYTQELTVVFPHLSGRLFFRAYINAQGTEELNEIREVCKHKLIQTVFATLRRNEE
jgi:hypothetical protein